MYLVFEYLFYLGLLAIVIGLILMISSLGGGRSQRVKFGALAILSGIALIVGPAVYSRQQVIDLGPRIVLVDGEKHITLTGWDGESYSVLESHPETIVLQIANADVTDQTLDHLAGMANLRELDLNDSQITDAGLAKLAKLTGLEILRLRGTKITGGGLVDHLGPLSKLKRVDLRDTMISAETIETWEALREGRRALH